MGVWHISLVLPRVLSPLISGVILDAVSDQVLVLSYPFLPFPYYANIIAGLYDSLFS